MQTCPSCGDLVPNEYVLCVWCGFDLTLEKIRKAGITIDNRDALARMVRVVTKPPSTFKEISLLPDNRGGKMVLFAIAVIMTFNMIAIMSKLDGLIMNSEEFESYLVIDLPILAPISLPWFGDNTIDFEIDIHIKLSGKFFINLFILAVQPLLLYLMFLQIWKVSIRILALLSRTFGGRVDNDKIKSVVGYSLIPVLIGWTLAWLSRLFTPEVNVSGSSYEDIQSGIKSFSEEGPGLIGLTFLYLGWAWTFALGIIGMKNASRLSWVEAFLVTLLSYGVFIAVVL